jgi:hypothetical protein
MRSELEKSTIHNNSMTDLIDQLIEEIDRRKEEKEKLKVKKRKTQPISEDDEVLKSAWRLIIWFGLKNLPSLVEELKKDGYDVREQVDKDFEVINKKLNNTAHSPQ